MNDSEQINQAWHQQAASGSLQRWRELAKKEGWQQSEASLQLMIRVFGASWYFTRFVFFRGKDILPLFAPENQQPARVEQAIMCLANRQLDNSHSQAIEQLRIVKNELMLSILLLQLGNVIQQAQAERLLTLLADNVLQVMYRLYGLDQLEETQCIVLAMGRFAGYEMNYGSDLDLIFIEQVADKTGFEQTFAQIRKMLRHIAMMDPSGALYAIDMRLRPHGSSGTLVTPLDSFVEFHAGKREIWERQMMTRSRVVCGDSGLSSRVQEAILGSVYQQYEHSYLASEIMKVRLLVEQELAGGKDSIELKRGKGGIMDIDFLTHYLQLAHGHDDPDFQQTSTRRLLDIARQKALLKESVASVLLEAYDFYKTSERALRIFDMKSISKLAMTTAAVLPVARAHGYLDEDHDQAVTRYLDKLFSYRDKVRFIFKEVLDH